MPSPFVQALRPLAPRLYSIASSQEAVGEEAHLTVARRRLRTRRQAPAGRGLGVPRRPAGRQATRARVFVEQNERFRLPADASRDVIMIGPGTGVAPFRGFLQHREAQGATGRNWLFFGARHFQSEFLYQVEWQDAVKKGVLSRLDLAFSRDRSIAARVRAGPPARAPARTCMRGSRAARTSTSAATPRRWRRT